jgi:hypothetical protein
MCRMCNWHSYQEGHHHHEQQGGPGPHQQGGHEVLQLYDVCILCGIEFENEILIMCETWTAEMVKWVISVLPPASTPPNADRE